MADENDLVNVSKKFIFLMYADDTTIYFNLKYFSGMNVEDMCQMN